MREIFTARLLGVAVLALLVSAAANAERVDVRTARTVAESFVLDDEAGREALPGRWVSGVSQWGNLWVARLSPSGYVVVAGSDCSAPIVAFSVRDFSGPRKGSAFRALLEKASARDGEDATAEDVSAFSAAAPSFARAVSLSASVDDSRSAERRAQWDALTGGAARSSSGMALTRSFANVPASSVVVRPFLTTQWSQWQPYNDFTPVWDADGTLAEDGFEVYRGRCPCGCVATCGAQLLRYWKWPAVIGGTVCGSVSYNDGSSTSALRMRFDGGTPFDWSGFWDDYPCYMYGFDLRGAVPESTRYPVARLVMLCDILAGMKFSEDTGSAYGDTFVMNASRWFRTGRTVSPAKNYSAAASAVKSSIMNGEPVLVTLPGHAAIGHGWAESGSSQYIYLNYGWGGDEDGYYNFDDTDLRTSESAIESVMVGFVPRMMAQMDPLPEVSCGPVSLGWHLPERYATGISGYTVGVYRRSETPSAFREGFLPGSGRASHPSVLYPSGGVLKLLAPSKSGSYELLSEVELTQDSALSYALRSSYALGYRLSVQASFNGGEWTSVSSPSLSTGATVSSGTVSASLAGHAGERARFRVVASFVGTRYYDACVLEVSNLSVSNALEYVPESTVQAGADSGTWMGVDGLEPGGAYAFSVRPDVSGAEESDRVYTVYAPDAAADATAAPAPPEILRVADAHGTALDEGFFRECALGKNVLLVQCGWSAVSLEARASHMSLLPDSSISVHNAGNGLFVVEIDASVVPANKARSRTILTLRARDARGVSACKDLVLRFNQDVEPQEYAGNVARADVMVDDADLTYTGEPLCPRVASVVLGGAELVEGEDFTVAYSDNVNAGVATVTLSGMNEYSGSFTHEFTIAPRPLSSKIVMPIDPVMHMGCAATPQIVAVNPFTGEDLVRGTDYTLAWKDNLAPGEAYALLSGAGNYCGTLAVPFEILARPPGQLVVGEYFRMGLAELGCDVPTDGVTAYGVKALGLPAGLKLVGSKAVTKKVGKKTVVVTPANVEWWIEGVPTAAMDFFTNPPYLAITANGTTTTEPLPIEVLAQEVKDLGELALGQTVNEQYYLPGVTSGWAVSGLPAGLKYTAKLVTTVKKNGKRIVSVTTNALPYSVYGKTAKAGLFTVTAKKKTGAYCETMKYRVLVRPKAVDKTVFGDGLADVTTMAYEKVVWDLTGDGGALGDRALPVVPSVVKVAGLPGGVTFAAKNTYAYANPKRKTGKYLKQKGQTIVGTPTKPGTYVVTFTKNVTAGTGKNRKTVAKTAQILWKVVPNDAELDLAFNNAGGVIESGSVGLKYGDLLAFAVTSNATVTASGLPAGIKLAKLDAGGRGATALPGGDGRAASPLAAVWGFQGFTAKAGTYLVTVKATLNGKSVTQRIALKVDALPDWAKGTFNGVVSGMEGTGNGISGLATVTVSAAGKISGKFQEYGTNWTFSAASYTDGRARSPSGPQSQSNGSQNTVETGTRDACPYQEFICSNVVAKYAYKVKSGKKTVTRYLTREFALRVAKRCDGDDAAATSAGGGVVTMEEVLCGSEDAAATSTVEGARIEAWQNLWARSDYKALGKSLFSTKSGKKTLAYKVFTVDVCTNEFGDVLLFTDEDRQSVEGYVPSLFATLSLKITTAGAVTATLTYDTGKTAVDKKTKKLVKVYWKPACATVVVPKTPADAECFEGEVFLYYAPSAANNFPGWSGVVPVGSW